MTSKIIGLTLLLVHFSFVNVSEENRYNLSTDEISSLESGEMVTQKIDHEDAPWPESTHFILMDISPIQAAALFWDYEEHGDWFEKMKVCIITKRHTPLDIEIEHVVKLPWPISETSYTTRSVLSAPSPNSYKVSWSFVSAEYTQEIKGSVTFEHYGNKTLLIYNNFVYPKSIIAGLFKSRAISDLEATVHEIVAVFSEKVAKESSYTAGEVEVIRKLLGV